jgi:hypothetical protein
MRKRDSKKMPSLESLVTRIRVERVYYAFIEIDDIDKGDFPNEQIYSSVWSTVEQASTPQEARRLYVDQLTKWHNHVTKWLRSATKDEQRQVAKAG